MPTLLLALFFILGPIAGRAQTGPAITQDLTNQSVVVGSDFSFSVVVSGAAPFSYQWQFDVANFPNNIATVAGNQGIGFSGDGGAGTNASLFYPGGVAVDAQSNLFIADTQNNRIREVGANGIITTIVGNGQAEYSGDGGAASSATVASPYGVAIDGSGNLFIADSGNNCIRKVDTNGIITTVAGNGIGAFSGDGSAATNANLNFPESVAVDAYGNLFILDTVNNRIREVFATNSIITTVAGNGVAGYSGDGGPATNASLNIPEGGVAVDAFGNLFIADFSNNRIREVGANGLITTFAGNGTAGYSGDGGAATNATLHAPLGVVVDLHGNLLIGDSENNCIRKVGTNGIITTVAGNGSAGFSGDGGPSIMAELYFPAGMAVDASGNWFIADPGNCCIREVFATNANNAPTLTLYNSVAASAGSYDVVVSNAYGSVTSSVATLTMQFPPTITAQPQNQTVGAGGVAAFGVTAEGTAPIFYQWLFNGAALAGQTNSVLTFNAATSNAGSYQVVVSNLYASATSSVAKLTVMLISAQPQNLTVGAGSNATFSVTAEGVPPFYYQWSFNGAALTGQTNSTLTFNAATVDAGSYKVVVSNLYGSATSTTATLNVVVIYAQPQSQMAAFGSNATFSVKVSAAAPFNYQWYFDGAALPSQTNGNLVLNAVNMTNAGSYDVVVMNALYGSATSSVATLTVVLPPTIAVQPHNKAIIAGSNSTLSVTVSGSGPFTYQWRENGTNLPNGIITTVAGGGNGSFSGDGGPATNAALDYPYAVAVDADDDLYIADTYNQRIRKVSENGIITTLAGTGTYSFSGDGGLAIAATLSYPAGVTVDASGNVFIADTDNNRIRKIGTNGIITTVAGGGTGGNGSAATNAILATPEGVAVDPDGNVLIADTGNEYIRKVIFSVILAMAGNGNAGYSGNGGAATLAALNHPYSLAVDNNGNLFIADMDNQRIREVLATTGIITNLAGNGTNGYSGDGGAATNAKLSNPHSVGLDSFGNLFFADTSNYRIREVRTNGIITTVAGSGNSGFSGDGGAATNSRLNTTYGIAVDPYGNLFIADTYNNRIRKVAIQGPTIFLNAFSSNVAGYYDVVVTGPSGSVTSSVATVSQVYPAAITAQPKSQVALLGSNLTFSVTASGTAPLSYQWYFGAAPLPGQTNPALILNNINSNNVGDYQVVINNLYGSVTSSLAASWLLAPVLQPSNPTFVAGGNATLYATVFGSGPLSYQWQLNGTNLPNDIITTVAGNGMYGFSGDGGPATSTELNEPSSVALDSYGNLLIADAQNNRIREVGVGGIIRTVAGTGANGFSGDGGPASNATLSNPRGVAVDAYDNFFISASGRIREVTYDIILTVAGGGNSYLGDGGPATSGELSDPCGVAVDAYDNLFIADSYDGRIRKVGVNGIITTVVGNGQMYGGYSGDGGPAFTAALDNPCGVAVDGYGDLFIADTGNRRIREVAASGIITTVAGNGNSGYSGDGGAATNASLDYPSGVAVDGYGDLFIADTENNRIREVGINGLISTVAGGGYGGDGGAATNAELNYPSGVALDSYGNLYIADTGNQRIRKVVFQGPTLALTNLPAGNSGQYDVVITGPYGSVTSAVFTVTTMLPMQNLSASVSPGLGAQIQFTGTATTAYVLQAATNLVPPIQWQSVVTNSTDANGNWTFTDTNALTATTRFYRALLP